MNRRAFIKRSAGTMAAISVSNLLIASDIISPLEQDYLDFVFEESKNSNGYKMTYKFQIPKSLRNCQKSDIKLTMKELRGVQNMPVAEYLIKVKKCSNVDMITDMTDSQKYELNLMTCKPYELIEGKDLITKSLDNNIIALAEKKSFIGIMPGGKHQSIIYLYDKKKVPFKRIAEENPKSSSSGGCFLTSVCVSHLGKKDDCYELQLLRDFRDQYVKTGMNGDELVKKYYEIGPEIVNYINLSPKRDEVLSAMYETLVKPSISLIENELLEEARQYYIDYTLAIHDSLSKNK